MHEYIVNWNNGGRSASFIVRAEGASELWAEIRRRIDPELVTSVWTIH